MTFDVDLFELVAERLEQLACFGDMFVLPAQTLEQIAPADKGRAQSCRRNAIVPGGFDEHPRIARVHRQPQHLPADGREICVWSPGFSRFGVRFRTDCRIG